MKIILKDGTTYQIKELVADLLSDMDFNLYKEQLGTNTNTFENHRLRLMPGDNVINNLYDIKNALTEDNISSVKYVLDDGSEITDSYKLSGNVQQYISATDNKTYINLIK